MQGAIKAVIVTLIPAVTFALGAAPAAAVEEPAGFGTAAVATAVPTGQSLVTSDALDDLTLSSLSQESELGRTPANFDVAAAIAQAELEVGSSRATGWSQPGECIMSAKRWIVAGGGDWTGSGDPVSTYEGALRLSLADAQPGDVVQYEHLLYATSWVSGVHTVLITEVHDDGTFTIIESNNPGGSGLVSKNERWTPAPPAGFQAVVWRF